MFPNGRPDQPHNFIGYNHPMGMPENEKKEIFNKCEHMIENRMLRIDHIVECYNGHIERLNVDVREIQKKLDAWNEDLEYLDSLNLNKRIESIDSKTNSLTEMYKDITLKVVRFQDYLANKAIKKKEQNLDNIFEFITVDQKGRDDIRHIRNALYDFYCWILDNVQENRERSIAITKLEECAMWLNKSISRRK